ncbi:FHA domain-containing protein [Arthrobacter sp. zg-Y411]|uniref:FtsK/SpoIIIE domain-containing protein n=1 Tax=Arthrobacter zhangbolii TaxID=2886936 RepID=UPI001D15D44B|nr:FHA domain-containing protein [Arthrobacter zhangbolii]
MVIQAAAGTTGPGIASLLTERFGEAALSIHGRALQELTPGQQPFVNGAVIVRSACPLSPAHEASRVVPGMPVAQLLLVVCSGPDAGNIIALRRGTYTVGRTQPPVFGTAPLRAGHRIGIADPALSRNHAQLVVATDSVSICDLGSANGTWVDGGRVRKAILHTGSTLRIGYSTCRLVLAGAPIPEHHDSGPQPEDPFSPLTVKLQEQGQKTGLLLLGALLPLVLGVVLAVATGMWMFLAFSALSAVTALVAAVSGSRRRREQAATVAAAAREDAQRRRRAAPDPGTTVVRTMVGAEALSHSTGRDRPPQAPMKPHGTGSSSDPSSVPVRIGAADQAANLEVHPVRPGFAPPQLQDAPVVLQLGRVREVSLHGPEAGALYRTILLQASAAAGARSEALILCAGTADELETDGRFLPGVTLAALPEASRSSLAEAGSRLRKLLPPYPRDRSTVLVLGVCGAWAGLAGELRDELPDDWRTGSTVIRLGGPPAAVHVSLVAARGILTQGSDTLEFLPDLLRAPVFSRLSRALGGSAPCSDPSPEVLPRRLAFDAFFASDPGVLLRNWQERGPDTAARDVQDGGAVVGLSATGPVTLDLDRDGPHFLVAGTTGAGKSEFLRAFITGLASIHPPTAFTVLLIDFKGGSGLGPLAALPHSVGILTDFSAENVSRALISLRAEVRRREVLLADAGADNLGAYNSGRPPLEHLPRLLVAVDEFRMLADAVPAALPELLRIAAVGRSLGLHLLLATQRPQGSITTDIRANIATSVALRVQSAPDSRDVINADSAADIPADLPGRAYAGISGRPALLFQSLSTGMRSINSHCTVLELGEYLTAGPAPDTQVSTAADTGTLSGICSAINEAAAAGNYPVPFRPVLQPLPTVLTASLLASAAHLRPEPGKLVLGIMDEPNLQRQRALAWHPRRDSHIAVLGSSRAGTSDCLALLAGRHLEVLPARHLYVLDSDGSLSWLDGADQTGAYVGAQDPKRAARVLAYLASELLRRMAPAAGGPSGTVPPGITVMVTGWSRWCTAFRSGRGLTGEEDLTDLIRDGERADICVVITGDREVLSSRSFPLIPNRLYFPADASAETLLLWPRLPPMDRVPGRALVQGRIGTDEGLSAQLQVPETAPKAAPPLPAAAARPHRIQSLPGVVNPDSLGPAVSADYVPVGVSGDELETATVRIPPASLFLVLGPRGSGRTSFLHQVKRAAHTSLDSRLVTGPADLLPVIDALDRTDEPPESMLVLVDNADSLPPPAHQQLAALQAKGVRLVLAALPGPQLTVRLPLAVQVRSAPRGVLLAPAGPADGEILGVRVDPATRHPAGRCYLVEGPVVREAQAAAATEPSG